MDHNTKLLIDEAIQAKLGPYLQKLSKIDEIEQSLASMADFYDILKKRIDVVEQRMDQACRDITIIQTKNINWDNELQQIKDGLDEMEQYIRRECLEIKGIPLTDDECTNDIVRNIGELIDVDISEEDISVSHRLPLGKNDKTKQDPTIIVKFVRRDIRDELYKARNALKNHTTSNLSGLDRHHPRHIYINESLTRNNRLLFKKSLEKKKDLKYKYIWTKYGRVLLRKDDNSPVVAIKSERDLIKL